jgi:hypothetical protein
MADRQAVMSEAFDTAQCDQSLHIKITNSFPGLEGFIACALR